MEQHLKFARSLAKLLDNSFEIGGIKIGLDAVLGFFPIGGDVIGVMLSAYFIWIAQKMKLPQHVIGKMVMNSMVDFMVGAIPLVGDVGDIFFKSNLRNLELLEKYAALQKHKAPTVVDAEVLE
ncbi:MAG TPA: DUF4112 domain-containing protein [Vitreimonas sp.]|nr:DUF4112 domain-containing protein [Vitreimonas sp.]